MPIFVPNGPNIPEQLLHLHDNGKVIFFYGAGISVHAGLPTIKGLVNSLYSIVGQDPTPLEREYIKKGQYDLAIEILEKNHKGGRIYIRRFLHSLLNPNSRNNKVLNLHKSLLQLSLTRKGQMHLITTNYDHLFKLSIKDDKKFKDISEYSAPFLPIPKPSKLNGIIYLHGVLDGNNDTNQDNLILSSSDFGHAYLTDGWDAKFVTELFKNYSVCFIGYSVNDPVMRYMVDAIAADRYRGDIIRNEVFAFASYGKDNYDKIKSEWENKNITPILYDSRSKGRSPRHAKLYNTLEKWAEIYSLGISGKKNIIKQYASNPPLTRYGKDDEAVGNVLWALTDPNAAKYFSEMTPPPPFEWLKPLSTPQFTENDLNRFGINETCNYSNSDFLFSFLDRPKPYKLSHMSLFDKEWVKSWDNIMFSLTNWLCKFLEDPKFILWIINNIGIINKNFKLRILDNLPTSKFGEIWSLILSNRIYMNSPEEFLDTYFIVDQIKKYGLNYGIKAQLEYILTPYLLVKNNITDIEHITIDNFFEKVTFDIKLRGGNLIDAMKIMDHTEIMHWNSKQYNIIDLLDYKLKEVCELRAIIDKINYKNDFSYRYLPSVEPHQQNENAAQWTTIVELLRKSWISLSKHDPFKAKIYSIKWWDTNYPIYKRLALYTFQFTNIIPVCKVIEFISIDRGYWFWSIETQREVYRWICNIKNKLNLSEFNNLEKLIISGPPVEIFSTHMSQNEINKYINFKKLIFLEKLKNNNFNFSKEVLNIYNSLVILFPKFRINDDESEEFAYWHGSKWEDIEYIQIPLTCKEIANYIEQYPEIDYWNPDNWDERCKNDFNVIYCALTKVTKRNIWPISRIKIFLSTSLSFHRTNEKKAREIFIKIYSLLIKAPDNILSELADIIAQWMLEISQIFIPNIEQYIKLVNKLILNINKDKEIDYFNKSISLFSPLAKLIESLITIWLHTHNEEFIKIFTLLCKSKSYILINGRIMLCRYILLFFNFNPIWTREYLYPLFNWENNQKEISAAWQAYLSTSYVELEFILDIKDNILNLIHYFDTLDKYKEHYVSLITYISLHYSEYFNRKELRKIFKLLPAEYLSVSINIIDNELHNIDSKKIEYWEKILYPFFHYIWPNDINTSVSDKLINEISRFVSNSDELFPLIVNSILLNWIQPIKYPHLIFHTLCKNSICSKYPKECLKFLDKLIGNNSYIYGTQIHKCLDMIYNNDPTLESQVTELKLRLI